MVCRVPHVGRCRRHEERVGPYSVRRMARLMRRFKTGLVLSEQPPLGEEEQMAFWGLYGGKPDVIGRDVEEVARQIVDRHRS